MKIQVKYIAELSRKGFEPRYLSSEKITQDLDQALRFETVSEAFRRAVEEAKTWVRPDQVQIKVYTLQ